MRLSNMMTAVDAHAAGEHGRVIVGGVLDVPGETMFDKMTYLENEADHIRKRMLREPRGYPAANCNLILPTTHPDADAGYVIMEQTEYPVMSGTNTIITTTVLLETGMLPMQEPVTDLTLESPAGLIKVRAECEGGKVKSVTFHNVPAFAVHLDVPVEVPQLGTITVDVAFGGMFFAIARAEDVGLSLTPDEGRDIVRVTEMIKAATRDQYPVSHPENPDYPGISIAMLTAPPTHPDAKAKNAVTVSTGDLNWERPSTWSGALDRSPCGTGTCARMAALHAKGQLGLDEPFPHEGILGTIFTGRLVEETTVGHHPAVVPTISGQAWITGFTHDVLDPTDPFPEGFKLGDIW